jgi:hypothetical protein
MEYDDFLREMEMRVNTRPLLVEENNHSAMVPNDMYKLQQVYQEQNY